MPRQMQTCQFSGKFLMVLPSPELRRLGRNEKRCERNALAFGEMVFHVRTDLLGIYVADHDKENVIGNVARLVIGKRIISRKPVKNIEITDDRMTARMRGKSRGKQGESRHAIGIV